MGPKSRSLFHFTKSLDYLKGILQHGFRPRLCLEDTSYLGVDYVAFPMSCFCDIPISRISEHTLFYGDYGLGMTKEWGQRNKLEPLLYAPSTGAVCDFINCFLKIEEKWQAADAKPIHDELDPHFGRIICITKPLSGKMLIGGKAVEKDFYQENEWRYVPVGYEMCSQDEFETGKDTKNLDLEKHALPFLPSDVKYIFVKADSEIPVIFDFIQNNLDIGL